MIEFVIVKNIVVRALIRRELKLNLRELNAKRKFFYPLAEPTYDENEVLSALNSMTSYSTTMWDKVKEFEKIFGDKYGGEAIMVNSGSSADLLISFGISEKSGGCLSPGSEILVPSLTWPTHLWSLIMAGFKVKLIDIDPKTLNFDLEHIEKNISKDTRGIFVVHLLGNMGDMRGLTKLCKEKNLVLMEDCCESLGSKLDGEYAGTFGIASSFSFFFSHHLVTMEGGMILTKDKELARRCRLLRAHGWDREVPDSAVSANLDIDSRYKFVNWGFNLRPTELQAGFGIEQIKKIDQYQALRDKNAALLEECINRNSKLLSTMQISNDVKCSWFAFPIIVNEKAPFSRKQLANFLDQKGIETRPVVAGNLAKQPATKQFPEITFEGLAGANFIHQQGLYIGLHPTTNRKNLNKVVQLLNNYCDQW